MAVQLRVQDERMFALWSDDTAREEESLDKLLVTANLLPS